MRSSLPTSRAVHTAQSVNARLTGVLDRHLRRQVAQRFAAGRQLAHDVVGIAGALHVQLEDVAGGETQLREGTRRPAWRHTHSSQCWPEPQMYSRNRTKFSPYQLLFSTVVTFQYCLVEVFKICQNNVKFFLN